MRATFVVPLFMQGVAAYAQGLNAHCTVYTVTESPNVVKLMVLNYATLTAHLPQSFTYAEPSISTVPHGLQLQDFTLLRPARYVYLGLIKAVLPDLPDPPDGCQGQGSHYINETRNKELSATLTSCEAIGGIRLHSGVVSN